MRLSTRNVVHVFILYIVWMVSLSIVSAVSSNLVHIPIAYGIPFSAASVCDGSAPILDQDTGDLDAILTTDGRFVLAYQDRSHGSLVHVAEHVGSRLEEIPGPAVVSMLAGSYPQFSPDGPKQGSVALVPMGGGKNRLYYTQRKIGDLDGPYGIWCVEF